MMNNLNIEFDLDGVLINYLDCLKEFLARRGIEHIPTGTWFFDTCPAIQGHKLTSYINEAMRLVDQIEPMPGAREVVKFLYEMTNEPIKIITNRPRINIDVTVKSIERVIGGIPYFFAMVDSPDKKSKYIRSKYFIDDRRRNAVILAEKGYTVFMPKREYNMPVDPGKQYAVWENKKVKHRGEWNRRDGNIIVIDEIKDLLKPEYLRMIVA